MKSSTKIKESTTGTAAAPEQRGIHPEHREAAEKVIDFLELQAYRDSLVVNLPYGVRKVVEMGRALCTEPALLLLDEPSSGLSVEETEDMAFWIQDIRSLLGIKYYKITGRTDNKQPYDPKAAMQRAADHADRHHRAQVAVHGSLRRLVFAQQQLAQHRQQRGRLPARVSPAVAARVHSNAAEGAAGRAAAAGREKTQKRDHQHRGVGAVSRRGAALSLAGTKSTPITLLRLA